MGDAANIINDNASFSKEEKEALDLFAHLIATAIINNTEKIRQSEKSNHVFTHINQ